MNKTVVAVLALLVSVSLSPINAQQHAPTIEVCRADVAVWGDPQAEIDYEKAEAEWFKNDVPDRTAIAKLSIREMSRRGDEMSQCEKVDPNQEKLYSGMQEFYNDVRRDRYARFLYRHHLMSQLEQEDTAGKR